MNLVPNQKLTALRWLWITCRGARAMPARTDFPVAVLRPWIGNLALIDLRDGGGAIFRVCGTELHQRFGGEFTKRDLAELDHAIGESLNRGIEAARLTHQPQELVHERVVHGRRIAFAELCLPLSEDEKVVSTVLFASYVIKKESNR